MHELFNVKTYIALYICLLHLNQAEKEMTQELKMITLRGISPKFTGYKAGFLTLHSIDGFCAASLFAADIALHIVGCSQHCWPLLTKSWYPIPTEL